jgi:hypothetical protein
MDSIRVSEAPDPSSILGMATILAAQQIVTLTAHNEHLLPYLITNTYLAFFYF